MRVLALLMALLTATPSWAVFAPSFRHEPHFEQVPPLALRPAPGPYRELPSAACVTALTPTQISDRATQIFATESNLARRPWDKKFLKYIEKAVTKDVLTRCAQMAPTGCTEADVVKLAAEGIETRMFRLHTLEHRTRVGGGISLILTVVGLSFFGIAMKDSLGAGHEGLSTALATIIPFAGGAIVGVMGQPLWRIMSNAGGAISFQAYSGKNIVLRNGQAEKFDNHYVAQRSSGLADDQMGAAMRLASAVSQVKDAAKTALKNWEEAQGLTDGGAADRKKTEAALAFAEAAHWIEEYLSFTPTREEDLIRVARNHFVRWVPDTAQRHELALRVWSELELMDPKQMDDAGARTRHTERLALWLELASDRVAR